MILQLVPRALIACCTLAIFSVSLTAQTSANRPQSNKASGISEATYFTDDDPVIVSTTDAGVVRSLETPKPSGASLGGPVVTLARVQPLLWAAIDERLGARYRWGSEGPYLFDCSGFVWSTFHSVGIDFERGSARTLWARFEAPAPQDTHKFGTLVFFSGRRHVGIVADEHGFYHASRHHGVVYSPFNDYWLKRIDGFRRVPLPLAESVPVVAKKLN